MEKGTNSVVEYYSWEDFEGDSFEIWVKELRDRLDGKLVDLAMVFVDPRLHSQFKDILEVVRIYGQAKILIGSSSNGLVANDKQFEHSLGVTLGLYHLPGATLKSVYLSPDKMNDLYHSKDKLSDYLEVKSTETNGWILLASPYRLHSEEMLQVWNSTYAPTPIMGGILNLGTPECPSQLFLNDRVYTDGIVGVSIGGNVTIQSKVIQGCRPFGCPYLVTKATGNIIYELNEMPAYEIFHSILEDLYNKQKHLGCGDLYIGLLMDSIGSNQLTDRYLVRNIIGADPFTGGIVTSGNPLVGQTIQFHIKDPLIVVENWAEAIEELQCSVNINKILGGCLLSSSARGIQFFGRESQEPKIVHSLLGPFPLIGSFFRSEFGPVGHFNFIHSQMSTLSLFVEKI